MRKKGAVSSDPRINFPVPAALRAAVREKARARGLTVQAVLISLMLKYVGWRSAE